MNNSGEDVVAVIMIIAILVTIGFGIYAIIVGLPALQCDRDTANIDLPNRCIVNTTCQVKYNGEWVDLDKYNWAVKQGLIQVPTQ